MSNLFKGAIFDLDGVITGTAIVHSLAWESMFNTYLKEHALANSEPFVPFDPAEDYLKYVDGKPRMEGVKSFLESRGIELPFGEMDDSEEQETVCGLGNRKNSASLKFSSRGAGSLHLFGYPHRKPHSKRHPHRHCLLQPQLPAHPPARKT